MQAVKEKLHDMTAMRKAKAEAKAEEKAEKEMAKARMDVAHEVRLAREAEAEMELHVAKAGQRVEREIAKHEFNENNMVPQNNNNNNINMDGKVCNHGSQNDDARSYGAGHASQTDNYCGGGGGGGNIINSNAATAAANCTSAGRAASFPHNERL
ncbi:hypothetical protein NC653_033833 [Populus alba x Populus x berolinensis]|uniref:Uncharacterized protein n=1 Tax=Populus alba x Populus x berolinensis TaxID=444605 RepID=A0AAD6LUL0_9ROSI|nr:hypothetical protein NC653_033833 [Populus alba x Populus x berolinensis]